MLSNNYHTILMSLTPHVAHRFICINPCSSVANKGFQDEFASQR
jgi:hypothetical protein